jgi:hypothetical protein
MPPEWMWCLTDELEEWFEEVQRKREIKYSSHDSSGEDDETIQNEWGQ